jgi:hypothetical protein
VCESRMRETCMSGSTSSDWKRDMRTRIEAPALPDNSYSPQCVLTAPVADSTDRDLGMVQVSFELVPLTSGVPERLAQRTVRRRAGQQRIDKATIVSATTYSWVNLRV